MIKKAHCLFEQSGAFKNEFIKLGIPAEDYDIRNDFGQTDNVIDLFKEIRGGYNGEPSIFDHINPDDLAIAFFPCIRFEDQTKMAFRGDLYQQTNYTDEQNLRMDIKLHSELNELYILICQLAIVAIKKGIRLVIENPYSTQHHLTMYWALKPALIDKDRTERGDYYKKPTQYWFINFEPKANFIFEPLEYTERLVIDKVKGRDGINKTVRRSMIHPQYANRFIREFLL